MSRNFEINSKNLIFSFSTIRYSRFGLCLLALLMLICTLMPVSMAHAKGGDTVSPFPAIDVRAGLQYAKAMAVDSTGNIIVVGYMNSGSSNDYLIAKFKADGSGLAAWAPVSYGSGGDDVATAVAIDSADNIIVTGYVWNGVNNDIHTVKYNGATGTVLWQHTYDVAGGNDTATAIAVDSSGDIYVAGYSFNGTRRDDFLVVKYPSGGATPVWTELYDDTAYPNNDNRIQSIYAGSGGFAVTGYSSKGGADFDLLTRKYAFDKSLIREWRYSSSGSRDDRGVAVKLDSDGNVIVTGFITNASNNTDIYTVKYSPGSSTPLWEQIYDGNGNDEPKGLWVDSAKDVYVTGYTTTLGGNQDYFTVRYSSNGAELWKAILDAGNGSTDIPVGIVADNSADGAVFVTGYSTVSGSEDYLTVKYKKDNGALLWEKSWNGSGNKNDRPVGIALEPAGGANPGNVCVAGWSDGATGYDFAAVKYDFGALNAPGGLSAVAASNSSITLNWKDNSSNEDRFYIQRKLGESGTFADIATVPATLPANTITYTDTGLAANNYYYYRVRAFNASNGDSYYSNEARALTKVVSYDSPVWKFIYNNADNLEDIATAITVGSDDHPVVTGYSNQSEEGVPGQYSYDYMTIKVDRANDQLIKWKAVYDSGDGGTDMASGVALDSSGNVIVTGTAYLSGGSEKSDDLYTIKYETSTHTDPVSNPPFMWDHQYGTQAGIDLATAIAMVRDGSNNSVVIGYGGNPAGNDDIFIIKYAADGSRPWTPIVYDSGRNDHPTAVALDKSGNIFVTGYSYDTAADPSGSYDWFTAKYDGSSGALIWSDTYNSSYGDDVATSIDVDNAGNAYVTGYAENAAGYYDFHTIKYDGAASPTNRRIWEKSYNNPANLDDQPVTVKVDPIDGAVVVAGTSFVSATDSDFHLIRYNSADGAVIWDRNFDVPGKYDYLMAMTMDSSGYIYLAGNSRTGPYTNAAYDDSSDVMSLIYDHEGTFLGAMTYNGSANKQDEATSIAVNYQGEAFIAGSTKNALNDDYLVYKQKNNYILVPAPFVPAPQPDYSKVNLTWRENTPGTSFRIERTLGPSTPLSVWGLVTTASSGTTTYQDSGLAAGTNYCYRIDAYSGSLNSRKIERCVTTSLGAPALNPLSVDSATQITLDWSQVADNAGYRIERKITAGGVWAELTTKTAGQTSHVDSGLTPGTIYYYRVSTISEAGFSLPGSELNAVTKPAAPSMSANGTVTSASVVVNWTDVAGETGFKIERKEGAAGSWSQVNTRGTNVLTYTDTGLNANTQYYYRVRAYNASGDSSYSGEQVALTKFTSPNLSSAAGTATNKVDLVWSNVAGNTGYTIQYSACSQNGATYGASYCTNPAYYSTWNNLAAGTDVIGYQVGSLVPGYAYSFRVIANTAGNSSDPSNTIIGWTQMTGPTLTITPASETSLTISWGDIAGETNYTLERKLGVAGTWAELAGSIGMAANTTTKTDTGLSLSTQYCYQVKAYSTNINGPSAVYNSNSSPEQCLFTPLAAPVQNAPSGVTSAQVALSWSNVTGNTGYEVQRCNYYDMQIPQNSTNPAYLNNDTYWNTCSTVATLAADTLTYQNTGLVAGYTYRYRIRDSYSGGYSAWSNAQAITTIPTAPSLNVPTSPSTSQINLVWNNTNGETGFNLEWKQRTGADCSAGAWGGPIPMSQNLTTYSHASLAAGTYYCYRIYASNSAGNSFYSAERSQTTLAVPPSVSDPSGVTAAQAILSWSQISGNTGYKIERKTGVSGAWSTIITTAADATSYTNSGLSAGTNYYYRISTNNAAGSSAASSEVSTTTTPLAPSVTATTVSADRIDLSWTVKSGATNYKIERKTGAGSYSQIDDVTAGYVENYCGYDFPTVACPSLSSVATVYASGGLTGNTTYCYQLKAWNLTGGDSAYSVEKCATTSAVSSQNLSASAVNSAKIRLDWTAVACVPIGCDNPDGFEIERQVRYGNWVRLAVVGGTTLSYIDTISIEPNKQYSYRVKTFKGSDKSPYSNTATATTPTYASSPSSCP